MRKVLTLRESLLYGILFVVVVSGIIFLLTLEPKPIDVDYYHQYSENIDDPDNIKIGVLVNQDFVEVENKWEETAVYLEAQVPGHTFEIVPLYFDEVQSNVDGKLVDFVIVNPTLYVELEVENGISRIATLENLYGTHNLTSFGSVTFTKSNTTSLSSYVDLKDRSFAAVDKDSFGGWQMTYKDMYDDGVDPLKDFESVTFLGTHEEVVLKVLDGTYDAGTVRTGVIEEMIAEGLISLSEIRVISKENTDFPFFKVSTKTYINRKLLIEWLNKISNEKRII